MITLKRHLMGGYGIADINGNPLGSIRQKLFSQRFTIVDPQGAALGYTDMDVHRPVDADHTVFENTAYVLVSAQGGGRRATGRPAYNESVDVTQLHTYLVKPPLADRMTLCLDGAADKLLLHIQMNGSATLSKEDQAVCGTVKHLGGGGFSVDLKRCEDTLLLCGIFLFIRYLLKENEPILV